MNIKERKQRETALRLATEYLMGTSQKKVCEFINSGKLNIDDGYLYEVEE